MKQQKLRIPAAILTLCGLLLFLYACSSHPEPSAVAGTLDGPLPADTAPAAVLDAIGHAELLRPFEIMSDPANDICVQALVEADSTPTDGYGIVVVKEGHPTLFPNLRNTRSPRASYDRENDILWLSCSAMEGTGVQVDWLFRIRFDEGNEAYIADTVNPYELQRQLCQRMGYSIDGQDITLWDQTEKIVTVTNTVENMGGFDNEKPVWIGEQMTYDLSGPAPRLLITPGVKFTTGLVLLYDDMPTLAVPLVLNEDGTVSLGGLEVVEVA